MSSCLEEITEHFLEKKRYVCDPILKIYIFTRNQLA